MAAKSRGGPTVRSAPGCSGRVTQLSRALLVPNPRPRAGPEVRSRQSAANSRNSTLLPMFVLVMARRRLGLTFLVIGIACVVAAPEAIASARWRVQHVPVAGPTLAGKRVVWVAPRRDHGGDLYVARPRH